MQPHPSDALVETVSSWLTQYVPSGWQKDAHTALSLLAERLREAEQERDAARMARLTTEGVSKTVRKQAAACVMAAEEERDAARAALQAIAHELGAVTQTPAEAAFAAHKIARAVLVGGTGAPFGVAWEEAEMRDAAAGGRVGGAS